MNLTKTQKLIIKDLVTMAKAMSTDEKDFASKKDCQLYNTNLDVILKEVEE